MALALLAAVAAGAVFLARSPSSDGSDKPAAMRPAAAFSLPELRPDRPVVTLASADGKPAVVNFFAAWCAPCKEELPALKEAAGAYPSVAFFGVDHQDSREDAIEIVEAFGVPYPAGYDPKGTVAARYGVRGLPATAFIDRDGQIVELHQGALTSRQLDERLRRLTLQSSGS